MLNLASDKVCPVDRYYGYWGLAAITHYLKESGEIKYAMPLEVLYPVAFTEFDVLLHKSDMQSFLTPQTLSIHLWGGGGNASLFG